MWHPFQIMPSHIAADEAVKSGAKPSPSCRMIYRERVIRWFLRDTDEDGYRLPNVDDRTGMTIEKRAAGGDHIELKVRHQKDLGVRHILQGSIKARRDDWRSPVSWDFTQEFPRGSGFGDFRESGEWEPGKARLVSRGGGREIVRIEAVASLTSLYSLLADFPARVNSYPESTETAVLEDVSVINRGARFQPVPQLVKEHEMASGLRGLALDYAANFPVEFWVNDHGAVIYACFGPNRALFLERIEEIS